MIILPAVGLRRVGRRGQRRWLAGSVGFTSRATCARRRRSASSTGASQVRRIKGRKFDIIIWGSFWQVWMAATRGFADSRRQGV